MNKLIPQPITIMRLSAMASAIVLTIIFFHSPCHADQPGISNQQTEGEVSAVAVSNAEENNSAVVERLKEEKKTRGSTFSITPHRQVYLLLATYDPDPNTEVYDFVYEDKPQNFEAKFQLSFKVQLFEDMFNSSGDLFCAYTQRSFWQVYDKLLSSPFRETNYEPEIFVKFDTDFNLLGFNNRAIVVGLNHQSNGRSGAASLSRSWNRLYADFILDRGNLAVGLKTWYRIPEDEEDDDNPDIEKYMGYGEFFGAYKLKKHVFSFMLRNNLRRSDNRGAMELGWSYPILNKLRVYVQAFTGYGESLVDYKDKTNKIGVGIMLFDWL